MLKSWLSSIEEWRKGLLKAFVPVARSPSGVPTPLRVDSTGALVVSGSISGGSGDGGLIPLSSGLTRAPTTALKTIATTRQELFALTSKQLGRYGLGLYNEGENPIYWGGSDVTVSNGFPLQPKEYIVINLHPENAAPVYAIAEANTPVRIVELA